MVHCAGIDSGVVVNRGAMRRASSGCKRDNRSGIIFLTPGMCFRRHIILYLRHTKTNRRTNFMIVGSFDDCLFRIVTTASLSQWKRTHWLDSMWPQR